MEAVNTDSEEMCWGVGTWSTCCVYEIKIHGLTFDTQQIGLFPATFYLTDFLCND